MDSHDVYQQVGDLVTMYHHPNHQPADICLEIGGVINLQALKKRTIASGRRKWSWWTRSKEPLSQPPVVRCQR